MMDDISLAEVIEAIGRHEIAKALKVGSPMISNAIKEDAAPPGWYATFVRLGGEKGVKVPPQKFKWRKPEDAPALNGEGTA